jgi:hypothetical protein
VLAARQGEVDNVTSDLDVELQLAARQTANKAIGILTLRANQGVL